MKAILNIDSSKIELDAKVAAKVFELLSTGAALESVCASDYRKSFYYREPPVLDLTLNEKRSDRDEFFTTKEEATEAREQNELALKEKYEASTDQAQ